VALNPSKPSSLTHHSVKSLLLFFGPILLPKAISYYNSVRSAPSNHGIPIRPIPPPILRALIILLITAIGFLLTTLYSPENIFTLTSSRLQIPTDVLFNRIQALRPGLTAADEALRSKIVSLESRLLYFQFGPDVIRDCQFCNAENSQSFVYYALPSITAPHLFNLCVLALVTSGLFTGKEGAIWRTTATYAALAVMIADIYVVSSYNKQGNAKATRLEDIDTFFWRMRGYRFLLLAGIDGMIGWLLYLSSTNRAFVTLPSPAERVENATRTIELTRNKLQYIGLLQNTVSRDAELRDKKQDYWVREVGMVQQAMEDPEVMEGVRNALGSRINIANVEAEAEGYARNIVEPLQGVTNTVVS